MQPFEKYNVTIGDAVVVAYATGDGSINAFGGEIGSSPKDEDLLLFLDDNAGVLMSQTYFVTWEIDIDADTLAYLKRKMRVELLEIQRRPDSIANVFDVIDEAGEKTRVDLEELKEVHILKGN